MYLLFYDLPNFIYYLLLFLIIFFNDLYLNRNETNETVYYLLVKLIIQIVSYFVKKKTTLITRIGPNWFVHIG